MTDYLLGSDGTPQREYARQAAADGIITYSYSTNDFKWIEPDSSIRWPSSSITKNPKPVDEQQSKWIDTIFDFIDSITGVQFQKVENQRGEIHLNLVDDGEEAYSPLSFLNGYTQWNGWHDKKQYGGIQDIRSIQTAIAGALGMTRPNNESGGSSYTWDDSLMAYRSGGMDSFGATFLYTQDDQTALKSILGSPNTDPITGEIIHNSEGRETLMIGRDGVKDVFQLTSKGMLLDRGTDENGWINHYNSSYIANLNPADGDKILIHRSLLDPKTPQFNQSKKLAKKYKKTKLSFMYEPGADTYKSKANVYYNGAGKLLMNTNGKKDGLTPKGSSKQPYLYKYNEAGINGQIAAFVDPIGPETIPFQSSWLDFFM